MNEKMVKQLMAELLRANARRLEAEKAAKESK